MDAKPLHATAARLAALDLSAESARIAELEAGIARVENAVDEADARRNEISQALAKAREPNGMAVADALLDGAGAIAAAAAGPDEDSMRSELASLRAGTGDLRKRQRVMQDEISMIRAAASDQAASFTKPLADAIEADLRAAAQQLLDGFAAALALNDATNGHRWLRSRAMNAAMSVVGLDKLIPWPTDIAVPAGIVDALRPLASKGAALRVTISERARLP